MKTKLFSNSNIKKCISIFGTCAILISPMYAMNTFRVNDDYYKITNYKSRFLDFRKNSVFNLFSRSDLVKNNISNALFEENKLTIDMLQKSYNMLKYYSDMELAFCDILYISKDIISELIRYISNYPYDGTFWSVCEIFQLTVECLVRSERRHLVYFDNISFCDKTIKENETTITFTRFKECMIARLEKLLALM